MLEPGLRRRLGRRPFGVQTKAADCFAWARFYAGGLAYYGGSYYGGFIGASAAAWYLLRADRFPFWKAADMAGMVVPLGLGFGRMGCLLAGCCFGSPTHSSLGLVFPPNSPASESEFKAGLLHSMAESSLSIHPTQIYESGACFAIAALLVLYVHGRKRYDGQVFLAFVALYAIVRFGLEFLRSDDRGSGLGLSTSHADWRVAGCRSARRTPLLVGEIGPSNGARVDSTE